MFLSFILLFKTLKHDIISILALWI
jgi:hypothetical protein